METINLNGVPETVHPYDATGYALSVLENDLKKKIKEINEAQKKRDFDPMREYADKRAKLLEMNDDLMKLPTADTLSQLMNDRNKLAKLHEEAKRFDPIKHYAKYAKIISKLSAEALDLKCAIQVLQIEHVNEIEGKQKLIEAPL